MKQTDTLGAPIPITPKYVDELIKKAQTVEELEQIRRDNTKLGLVLVLAFYDAENIELLTDLAIAG